ncbi:phosphofructokinase [Mycobacterium sp. ENV421]|uniref:1-phosphofructokinase family hexose kinase n=1 Tax=Mycobacterium sp. ENV421 TaxID=1213407 RepID=UPI000C9AF704|nr:1-phosphofructokinase family hexose kinase [Mycobacterium sp. ENV421]PND58093.1 phosphofructokinase [Mycobacterium sp. ENV421]
MSAPVIVTVTLNPALDITVDAERVGPTDKVRCCADRYDAGGGGLNVARFARALGAPVSAVLTAGGPIGARLVELLDDAIVPNTFIALRGDTRESFTVNERSTGRQYRFVLPGPVLTTDEQQRCLEVIDASATGAAFVVASGSLPPGVPADFYQRIADICRTRQVRLVLDTSGGGLEHITSGVFLLKPSVRELRECVGSPLATEGEQIAAARHLIDRGVAEVIVVSLGADGALLVTGDWCRRLAPVAVPTVSGVGAGDAMVAGIVVGLSREWGIESAVRYGIAAATAKLQTPGTSTFDRADVDRYLDQVPAPTSVVAQCSDLGL